MEIIGPDENGLPAKVEELSIKMGILALASVISAVALAVLHGFLLLDVRLLNYLQPLGTGIALIVAVLLGLAIGKLVTGYLWDILVGFRLLSELAVTDRLDEFVRQTHPIGLVLGYLFLGLLGTGTYIGGHRRASFVVSMTGLPSRVAHPSDLFASAVVLLLDWASAFGFVAVVSGLTALHARLIWLVPARKRSALLKRRTFFHPPRVDRLIWWALPLSVLQSEHESADSELIHDFTARLGLAGILVAGISLVGWAVVGTTCFSPARCPEGVRSVLEMVVIGIASLIGLSVLAGFVSGFVEPSTTDGTLVLRPRSRAETAFGAVSRLLTLKTDSPLFSVLLGSAFTAACLALYAVSVSLFPETRSEMPPFPTSSGGIVPSYTRIHLLEIARIASVVGSVSYPVVVSVRSREWWEASTVAIAYETFQSMLGTVSELESRVFTTINGVGETEQPSRWAPWVRITFFAQMFMFTYTMDGYLRSQVEVLAVGTAFALLLAQAATVARDLQARRGRLRWREMIWIALVLLVPVGGAFLYVVREYWPSDADNTSES